MYSEQLSDVSCSAEERSVARDGMVGTALPSPDIISRERERANVDRARRHAIQPMKE